MRDWDAIYREQGVIQKNPMPFIIENIRTLKENNVKRVLDLGCGTGRHLTLLLDEGFEVHGLDASPKAIELLEQVLADKAASAELKVGEFTEIPWPEDHFDAIVCTNVIQHAKIHEIHAAASEIHRVLRSGGVLLFATLSTKDGAYGIGEQIEENTFITGVQPDGDLPHHFFTQEELRDMFLGFDLISLKEVEKKSELREIDLGVLWQLVGRRK